MTLALGFLLNGLVIIIFGPPALGRLASSGASPRLALAAWVVAMVVVLASGVAAAGAAGIDLLRSGGHLHLVFADCLEVLGSMLHGRSGGAVQTAVVVLAGLAVVGVVALLGRLGLLLHRSRSRTFRHCRTAWLVRDPSPGPGGALVLDTTELAVYCVAGRRPAIVVTRGALDVLDEEQMTAVLSHERAHLTGRHHLLVAASRAAATTLPRVRLFVCGAEAIARLVELRADDVATRHHRRATLVAAMLALSGAGPLPTDALAASNVGVADRAQHLLNPPGPAGGPALRRAWGLTGAAMLAGPVMATVGLVAVPVLCRLVF